MKFTEALKKIEAIMNKQIPLCTETQKSNNQKENIPHQSMNKRNKI